VKQGDPLSPLLFNLLMDPIIEELNAATEGLPIGDTKVAVLAFADDLILLATSKEDAQKQLNLIYGQLDRLGMCLSIGKCLVVKVIPKKKTWIV
jgi:hypothetical protein